MTTSPKPGNASEQIPEPDHNDWLELYRPIPHIAEEIDNRDPENAFDACYLCIQNLHARLARIENELRNLLD